MVSPSGPSLSGKHVIVIGAGGLGCAVLPRIARMAIARLTILDGDRVEAANLERQPLFEDMDIGFPKASTAAGWMRQIMVGGEVIAHNVFIDAGNAATLIAGADVVVEGVDDLHAKQLIDRICGELGVPLVSGGVHQRQGQVMVLHASGEHAAMSRGDVFTGKTGAGQDGCDMRDVPVDLLDETGRIMAARARQVLRSEVLVNGRIELFDARRKEWATIDPAF